MKSKSNAQPSSKRPVWLPPINGAAIIGPLVIATSMSEKFSYEEMSLSGGVGTLFVTGLLLVTLAIAIAEYAQYKIPVISRAAALVLDRTINMKRNWENDTLRSMIETACWLHLTMLLHTETRNMFFSAPGGALCGLGLVVAGDLATSTLRSAERLLFKTNTFRSLKLPASLTEIISLGAVLVFCVVFRIGNEMRNTISSVALASLSLVILAQVLMQMPPGDPSWHVGRLIHHRMTHATQNWIDFPLRSIVEGSAFISCILGSHWLVADEIASAVIGSLTGILIVVMVEHLTMTRISGRTKKQEEPEELRWSWLSHLLHLNAQLSHYIYVASSKSSALKIVSTAFSLLVDDATCLAFLISSWIFVLYRQHQGSAVPSCAAEAIVEAYLLFMPWSAIETAIKLIVREPRPYYAKQKELSSVVIPGDQFSWPSGHSLRAFAMARAPFASTALQRMGYSLAGSPSAPQLQLLLLSLALISGWSRVALGKHSLVDVVSGAFCGLMWFPVFEGMSSDTHRFTLQMTCACYYALVAVAAACSGRIQHFLGFVDADQAPFYSSTIVWGTWMYCLARLDGPYALGHHDFQQCGVGPDVSSVSGPWPAAGAAGVLSCSLLYAGLAGKSYVWRPLVLPALGFAVIALETTGFIDLGVLAFLRPPALS